MENIFVLNNHLMLDRCFLITNYSTPLYYKLCQMLIASFYSLTSVPMGNSDGGVFAASSLSEFINEKNNFPPDCVVQGSNVRLPYLFVCDDAYPLKNNMMKPYGGKNLTPEKDIYNGRLSRTRRCVECAFGILANKWRLLRKQIETKPETAEIIVKCLTVLHNVVINKEGIDEKLMTAVKEKTEARETASLHTGRKLCN